MSDSAPTLLSRMRDRDHTRGHMSVSVLVLAIPSILTSVGAFGLFQLVDLAFLGRIGPEAVAAAGATNQTLRQAVFLVVLGITTSSQMTIARVVGAGNVDAAEHFAGQTLLLGGVLSVVTLGLGLFWAEPMIALVSPDPSVVEMGAAYVRIAFVFLFVTIFTQIASGILNGAGDATSPMISGFLVTPVALVAEWALGFGHLGLPALGIRGIALGAAIGGMAGAAYLLGVLFRGRSRVHIRARHLRPDPDALRTLGRFAWQPSLHFLARTTIVFFFMFLAGRLGGNVQAAYTIGLRVEMLGIMIAFPVANACATLVGQNLGAGDVARAWRAVRVTFGLQALMLWPAALLLFAVRGAIVSVFSDDAAVLAMAAEYLGYSSVVLAFYGFYFTAFRTLQAAGDMNSPMVISIGVALVLGIPLGWALSTRADLGATGMWIANLCYALVNCALMVAWLWRGRWARP